MALLVWKERGAYFIDERHHYVVGTGNSVRVEQALIRRPYNWDWPTLVRLFAKAGFEQIRCLQFELEGQPMLVNTARRPQTAP